MATTAKAVISCFQCSILGRSEKTCPDSTDNFNTWSKENEKFTALSNAFDLCSILVGKSGRIYHQGGMSRSRCESISVRRTMSLQVAEKFRDPDSRLQCCSKNGCNWSLQTATMGDGGGSIDDGFSSGSLTDSTTDTTIVAALGFVVLGLVLLCLILFLCFLLYKRHNSSEQKDEGVQAANLRGMYNKKYYQEYSDLDRASSKNSNGGQYPVSRGSNKISVREAETDFIADKWRRQSTLGYKEKYDINGHKLSHEVGNIKYSTSQFDKPENSAFDRKYDGVDTDWIDLKSNNYFSNEDTGEKTRKRSKDDKPQAWFVEY